MLVDAAFVGQLSLPNITSIAVVTGIFINNARQAMRWHSILETKPQLGAILLFIYKP